MQITVMLAGDVCFHNCDRERVDVEYGRRVLSEVMPILERADYRLMNLENPLVTSPTPIAKSGPPLYGIPKNIGFFKAAKVDCAILANNHIGDQGDQAVLDTCSLLRREGIGYAGGGADVDEAYRAWVCEKDGIRISVLCVAENEFGIAGWGKPGAAGIQMGLLRDRIAEEKGMSDFVLVVVHGGNENNPFPSPGVRERYRLAVDFGADAVIGMHPHCPQGHEAYRGAPIVYSVGNFYFCSTGEREADDPWYYGYIPELTFQKGQPVSLQIHPYRAAQDGTSILPLAGDAKDAFLDYIRTISEPIADRRKLEWYFKGWCMETGPIYAGMLSYSPAYLTDSSLRETPNLLNLCNNFTCEAHSELLKTLLKLIAGGEIEEARSILPHVRKFMHIPLGGQNDVSNVDR